MGEPSAGAVLVLIEAIVAEYARELPRRKRDAFLRNIAVDLKPEPAPMVCRERATHMREAAEWWLHRVPRFLRD